MPFYDCHCHSNHSPDSKMTLDVIAEKAMELGFDGIAITNHFDPFDPTSTPEHAAFTHERVLKSLEDITEAKLRYAGKLEIFCGAELGAPFRCLDYCTPIIEDGRVDVILGSVHNISYISDNGEMHGYNPYKERNREWYDRMVEAYFTDVYRNIAFCDIDVVTHMTYLQRYIINGSEILFDTKKYIDACMDLMKAAISRGIAVELNSKSIVSCANPVLSELEFFKLYKSLGGELVTIGNDAHCLADFDNWRFATDLLKAAGFESACYYKGRKPVFYSL